MRNTHGKHVLLMSIFVGGTQPGPKETAFVSKPNPKDPSKRQRIESGQTNPCSSLTKVQLDALTGEPSL